MMSFRGTRLQDLLLPQPTVWMLETLAEATGRQQLYEHQSPQVLEALREMALVESAESSNRIEGVVVDPRKKDSPDLRGRVRISLAELIAGTPEESADLYRKGVEAGERALGAEFFEEGVGHFCGGGRRRRSWGTRARRTGTWSRRAHAGSWCREPSTG